jgi:SAM-dependent methyltransferase
VTSERPFYGSFAWAYDLLSDRPVAEACAFVAAVLAQQGIAAGARVLDAGCGTGRYTRTLASHGYRVTGVDRSEELLAGARRGGGRFVAADLIALPLRRACAGVLCRGVLNDVLEDDARRAVLRALAGALVDGGVLVLDVRDWDATVRAKGLRPIHERTVSTERGTLTFRSETRLQPATRRLLISERHVLTAGGESCTQAHEFVMGCWTRDELTARLIDAGFGTMVFHAGYIAPADEPPDRLVAVARREP